MNAVKYLFPFLFLLFNSCAQLTFLQDARTYGKNNGHAGATLTAYGTNDPGNDEVIAGGAVPFGILHGSYGLSDKVDVQYSISSAFNVYGGVKLQVVGDRQSRFALSLLPGLEYQFIGGNNEGFIRPHLSLIGSFHPSERFAVFLEPKFIAQFFDDERFFFPGASLGVKFQVTDRIDVSLGGSLFKVENDDTVSNACLLYTSPSPRDATLSRMPSSA